MHIHELAGCTPEPLGFYLKALGVLRLVAEQADPGARGWWRDERFFLATELDAGRLLTFFREEYSPSPVFNPWGGRSGYYPGSPEKGARTALEQIERAGEPRLKPFCDAIRVIRRRVGTAKPKDDDGETLIRRLRAETPAEAVAWLDASVAITGDGITYPALFGTGGNEGSGSYTSGFMAAVVDCLVRRAWDEALEAALFKTGPSRGTHWNGSFGHFIPDAQASPWDLLLSFEGAMLISSSVATRSEGTRGPGNRWVSSPFFVAPLSTGYGSATQRDEVIVNKGKTMPGRGEQWFPLWEQPATQGEIRKVLADGRATIGRGRATDGFSLARSAASLGVQVGLSSFVRFGYQQRNNYATHFAVPLGRVKVATIPSSRLVALEDVHGWTKWLARAARAKNAPARLRLVEHRLADALFTVVQHPDEPARWQEVLLGLAAVEELQVAGTAFEVGPVPRLGPDWVTAADDGGPELRLALAFALQGFSYERTGRWDGVRRHWLPLDPRTGRFATAGDSGRARLFARPEAVLRGRGGLQDALAMVQRRLVEAGQRGLRNLPLRPAPRAAAAPQDLAGLLRGAVDLNRTLALGRALMALDRRRWNESRVRLVAQAGDSGVASSGASHTDWPDDGWLAVRLANLPSPLREGRAVAVDPAIVRRLAAGDAISAVALAAQRLRAAGLHVPLATVVADAQTASRWGAALAFPISSRTALAFARRLDPAFDRKE